MKVLEKEEEREEEEPAESEDECSRDRPKPRKMRAFPHVVDLAEWRKKNRLEPETRVFILTGGYSSLRQALYERGWVRNPDPGSPCFDLKYTLQSREIDFNALRDGQMVNHYVKNSCITTKIGLCKSLKNVVWSNSEDINEFYPRCYDLNDEDDYESFLDDFKLCKCMALLKKYLRLSKELKVDESISQKAALAAKVLQRRETSLDDLIDQKRAFTLITEKEWALLIDD